MGVAIVQFTHDILHGRDEGFVVGGLLDMLQVAVVTGKPVAADLPLEYAEEGVVLFEGFVEVLEILSFLFRGEAVLGSCGCTDGAERND